MKKTLYTFALSIAVVLALFLTGCSFQKDTLPDNYAVGIIRTVGNKNRSDILYFNENLEQTGVTHYKYATMGGVFYKPVVFDGSLYVVPQGMANKKDLGIVFRQDLTTFEQEEFTVDQLAINGISVDQSAVYTVNTLNGNSIISKVNKKDGSIETLTYEGIYIPIVYVYNDVLYAFSEQHLDTKIESTLYCINPENLSEINKMDISHLGTTIYSVVGIEDMLYFAPKTTDKDELNHIVGTYNISDGKTGSIECGVSAQHLLQVDDKLYITHGDVVNGEGSTISIYEINTGEIASYDLGMWPGQIAVYNDSLYVMGEDKIAKFDTQTMAKQAEVNVSLDTGYYLSGIFP